MSIARSSLLRMLLVVVPLLTAVPLITSSANAAAEPIAASISLSAAEARPGDELGLTLRLQNNGLKRFRVNATITVRDPGGNVIHTRSWQNLRSSSTLDLNDRVTLTMSSVPGLYRVGVTVEESRGRPPTVYVNDDSMATFAVKDSVQQGNDPAPDPTATPSPPSEPTATPSPEPTATATPSPTPEPTSPPVAGNDLQIGAYVAGGAQNPSLYNAFEQMVGHRTEIIHWYQPWGANYSNGSWYQSELDVEAMQAAANRGAIPMITWEPWGQINGKDVSRVRNIATGSFNDYIDAWAIGIRDYGGPVYLRPFHEMNNSSYPWAYGQNGNTATDLVNAWRHLHNRFEQAGATNVIWVWSPNTENSLVKYTDIYPGDSYVDWFGIDGYNGGDVYPEWWGGWVTPNEIFYWSLISIDQINASKPIMIAETATVEQGGNKADWIEELYVNLPATYPRIRAVLWFNEDWGKNQADWKVDSSPSALEAYRNSAGQHSQP